MSRSPVGALMHEHRLIERVIEVMRQQAAMIGEVGRTDPAIIDSTTDFLLSYADACHHGKEEQLLFPALKDKPLDEKAAQVMAELIEEHEQVRHLTHGLAETNRAYRNGDERALEDIASALRELTRVYPAHVEKENRYFFREAVKYLSAEEREAMAEQFEEFDRSLVHRKYAQITESLERSVRREDDVEVLAHH